MSEVLTINTDQSKVAEPLLSNADNRFIMFPIKDQELWVMYKKAIASFWHVGEICLDTDISDWKTTLNSHERRFISLVLAFFAASDGVVNENLASRFYTEVTAPEARSFYSFQIMIENVHAETYALLISTLVVDPDEQFSLFSAIRDVPCVAAKARWAMKWSQDQRTPFSLRLIAFAAVEGIFFSSSFASIFWLRQKNVMPGLCFANELISRDEGLHQEFACALFRRIVHKPKRRAVLRIIKDAVKLEQAFAKEAIGVDLIGMSIESMSCYIEFVADRLLAMLGYGVCYHSINPFAFMDLISIDGRANFFERPVSAYRLPHVDIVDYHALDYLDIEW